MNYRYIFLPIALLSWSSFAREISPSYLTEVFQCQPLAEQNYLCVIDTENTGSEWFFLRQQWRPLKIEHMPQSLMQLSEFKVSPNRKWVAIMSVGEGHPILDVIDLNEVIANQEGGNYSGQHSTNEVKALHTINPYPGTINLVAWQGEKLIFTTDRWLAYDTPLFHDDGAKFAINPLTGVIQPLSADLADPITYYGKILKAKPEKWQLLETIAALEKINKLAAIPLLEQALKLQKDKDIKDVIQETIKAIKTNQQPKATQDKP